MLLLRRTHGLPMHVSFHHQGRLLTSPAPRAPRPPKPQAWRRRLDQLIGIERAIERASERKKLKRNLSSFCLLSLCLSLSPLRVSAAVLCAASLSLSLSFSLSLQTLPELTRVSINDVYCRICERSRLFIGNCVFWQFLGSPNANVRSQQTTTNDFSNLENLSRTSFPKKKKIEKMCCKITTQ